MTRVYRDPVAGVTWIERGTGGPVLIVTDHGAPPFDQQWHAPDLSTLVYDDELHGVENDHLTDTRDRLIKAVAESDLAATVKARVRSMITEVIK